MPRRASLVIPLVFAGALGFGGVVALRDPGAVVDVAQAAVSSNCTIKGNVSFDSGERIYHMPGQRYYGETQISSQRGERWFCSEQEARQAGWRRSRV